MKKLPFEMAKLDLGQYGINLVSCHGSLGEQAMLQSLNGSQIPQPLLRILELLRSLKLILT